MSFNILSNLDDVSSLYSSVGRTSFLSLSGYDKLLHALTNLVAWRLIFQ